MRIFGRIVVALLLGMIILIVASAIIMSLPDAHRLFEEYPWLMGFIPHTSMLIISTLILFILGKGKLGQYGYKLPVNFSFSQIVILPLAVGVIANVILTFMPTAESFAPEGYTFGHIVVFIWLYASICEEIYTRGLIQGYLKPLADHALTVFKIRLSLPVIIAAAFFSLIHLMAFATTLNPFALVVFLIIAFILGLIAGYQLEKTGSLLPAVIVHMMFNISGSVVDSVFRFIG
jgi:membrane protease YdiL (CAAX protease family)